MLATRLAQKDSVFYFAAFPARDLLRRVRFTSRFESDGEAIAGTEIHKARREDPVADFIARIEKSDDAFQREPKRRKVSDIRNFYETCGTNPMIPGSVLLYTAEPLSFDPISSLQDVGNLHDPAEPFLVIDGQHRLAALHFHLEAHPEEAEALRVPCMIFDGRNQDFAAEMFVVINSTATRINKGHLVDLFEKVQSATPAQRVAAEVCRHLYEEGDSPLRYRIFRLGGRSRQEKWIQQAELFNELHRRLKDFERQDLPKARTLYGSLRDFLRAAREAWGPAWGDPNLMVTRPVVLKAMIRAALPVILSGGDEGGTYWRGRLDEWGRHVDEFRRDGFYQRFAAKGELERVGMVHRALARWAGLAGREG